MAAMILGSPPTQRGQRRRSLSMTCLHNQARPMRPGRSRRVSTSRSAAAAALDAACACAAAASARPAPARLQRAPAPHARALRRARAQRRTDACRPGCKVAAQTKLTCFEPVMPCDRLAVWRADGHRCRFHPGQASRHAGTASPAPCESHRTRHGLRPSHVGAGNGPDDRSSCDSPALPCHRAGLRARALLWPGGRGRRRPHRNPMTSPCASSQSA